MMTNTDDILNPLSRLNALLAWWGSPNKLDQGAVEAQTAHFRTVATELGEAFGEATTRQVDTLSAANERLARSLKDLLCSRRPQDVMAVQLGIVAALLDSVAVQARTWAELTQKVQSTCATIPPEATGSATVEAGATPISEPAKASRSSGDPPKAGH
jgi:hypothetical protein